MVASLHTDNRVWGCAKNPYDNTRSCAGSSGGDAGLVASRCTPLAFGTDDSGSIRVPSTFLGTCGFTPTAKRVSAEGCP
jgi:Asp-tRNA(Asn)/Glu-tRNA(Gln) amidotransferase A subunit family amidase